MSGFLFRLSNPGMNHIGFFFNAKSCIIEGHRNLRWIMKLAEISRVIKGEILTCRHAPDLDIQSACSADLMSDVMAFSKENAMLLTGLINPQVIRTCEMMDIKVIVFVRGKKPQQNMIDMAEEKGIALISTDYPMFAASGKLYVNGIHGRGE
jgi:predicted transcriptional regulator